MFNTPFNSTAKEILYAGLLGSNLFKNHILFCAKERGNLLFLRGVGKICGMRFFGASKNRLLTASANCLRLLKSNNSFRGTSIFNLLFIWEII